MLVANNDILERLEKAKKSRKQCTALSDNKRAELSRKQTQINSNKYSVGQNKAGVATKNVKLLEAKNNSKTPHTNAGLETSLAVNTTKPLTRDKTQDFNELYSKRFGKQSELIRAKPSPNVSHGKQDSETPTSGKYFMKEKANLSTKFLQNTHNSKLPQFNNRKKPNLIKEPSVNLSQNLVPEITHLTSTDANFRPKAASILSQHYSCPQTTTFTWVKYKIPIPPPNLEVVERKLYPHRFKIKVEEISLFTRIPTPPPHMPEAIRFPLLELIPAPPPDIPWDLLGEAAPQVRIKTDRIPNPILSIIPAPPPDIPNYLIGEIMSRQLSIRTDRNPNPILSIIPAPPPDLPSELTFPPPPPPFVCSDSFDSSGSWDSYPDPPPSPGTSPPPLDAAELHALHLQEIVSAAELREKEREKSKYRKAKQSEPNFHQLHLEEIRNTSLEKQQERIKNKKSLKTEEPRNYPHRHALLAEIATKLTSKQLSLHLPNLEKQPYFTNLISELGLTYHNFDIYTVDKTSSINLTLDEKIHLLIELENSLLTGVPVATGLIEPLKLICFSSFPDLTRCYNHMSQHLTPKMYDRLSRIRTRSGFKIDRAIQTGIDNPGDPFNISVGCVAGDEESYSVFSELFDLVIYSTHRGYTADRVHCSNLDPVSITDGNFDPNFVFSCQVLAGRSIRGFPLLSHCTRAERRSVESVVKECVCNLPHPYKGHYYSLKELTLEDHGYLSKRKFLFSKPVAPSVIVSRMTRDWPDSRGLWLNRDENFMAWVNEEDHVRLISIEEGGDLRGAFERYCLGVQLFEMTVLLRGYEVMKNDHIGYILTCPSNLGTGMVITLLVRLPMLLAFARLGIILEYLHLEKRGAGNTETGEFEISNIDRLGITEVEITQKLIHGVQLLIRMEKTLWSGLCIQEFLREVNPELANLILVGVYPKVPIKRITIPGNYIPDPPPDIICL